MPSTETPPVLAGTEAGSDVALVAEVADRIRRPRRDPADSFVLHAPLELAARSALLPRVDESARDEARARIEDIATGYEAFGPPVDEPEHRAGAAGSPAAVAAELATAIDAGELDDVDVTASALARVATGPELRAVLAPVVVDRLAAAAHAPIFLYQLPRVAPRGELTLELVRPLVRELARQPDWRLSWHHRRARARRIPADALRGALAATPRLGLPGSAFIHPVMSQAESSGIAAELLRGPTAGVAVDEGARVVLRAAAWSMLDEPTDHAPYGWTHCLTMPQAVLGLADVLEPRIALAVASTYVVGFRAAMAQRPLSEASPPDPEIDLTRAIAAGPDVAAAAAWHAPAPALSRVVTELSARAAVHPDAHYAKYTLACLDAAAFDRDHARLYLAAAAKLAGFWAASP